MMGLCVFTMHDQSGGDTGAGKSLDSFFTDTSHPMEVSQKNIQMIVTQYGNDTASTTLF